MSCSSHRCVDTEVILFVVPQLVHCLVDMYDMQRTTLATTIEPHSLREITKIQITALEHMTVGAVRDRGSRSQIRLLPGPPLPA